MVRYGTFVSQVTLTLGPEEKQKGGRMMRSLIPGVLRRLGVQFLLTALLGSFAGAAIAADEAPDPDGDSVSSALVQIDGRTILRVWGSAGYPANERARAIERRIVDLARDRSIPVESITLQENERGTALQAGDVRLLAVTDGDAALEETNRQTLALATLAATRDAVQSWRFERSTERRLRNLYWTIGATVATAIVLWLLGRIFRRIRRFVAERASARIKAVGVQSFEVIHASQIHAALATLPRLGYGLAVAVTLYVYLDVVLKLFPLTRPLGQRLFWLVVGPLETFGIAFVARFPTCSSWSCSWSSCASRCGSCACFSKPSGVVPSIRQFRGGVGNSHLQGPAVFVVAFAVVVAYPYIPGSESDAFKGVSLFLGVLFSLGSSSVIVQHHCRLQHDLPPRVPGRRPGEDRRRRRRGRRVRLQVTHLRTLKNERVTVPNSVDPQQRGRQLQRDGATRGPDPPHDGRHRYETPWRQVEAMLLEAARRTPGLRANRLRSSCSRRSAISASPTRSTPTATTRAACWSSTPRCTQHPRPVQRVRRADHDAGVQGDPTKPKVVRTDDWFTAPAVAPAPAAPAAEATSAQCDSKNS